MWNSWNPDFLKKMRMIWAFLHMLPRHFNIHYDFAETTTFKSLFFFLEDFCIRISLHGFVAFLNLQEWPIRKTHAYASHSVTAHNLNLLVSVEYLDRCLFKKGKSPHFFLLCGLSNWAPGFFIVNYSMWQVLLYFLCFAVIEYFSSSLHQNPIELKTCASAMSFWHWECPNTEINVTCRLKLWSN